MTNQRIHQLFALRWVTAMGLFIIHCSLFISGAAAQVKVEYWFDHDPGCGQGTVVTATADADGSLLFDAPTNTLSEGRHLMGVRSFSTDAEGHACFGPTLVRHIAVMRPDNDGGISRIEYFWDNDPGYGHGTPISITPGQEISLPNLEISTEGLTPGRHVLHIRPYNGDGWGPTISQTVAVSSGPLAIQFVEYFWDNDPGYGKATRLAIAGGKEVHLEDLEIPTADLPAGLHYLGIRALGGAGKGATMMMETYVHMRQEEALVANAEYFWDEEPGFGEGTPIEITPGQEISVTGLGISTEELSTGPHLLFVRYRGINGWGPTMCNDVNIMPEIKVMNAEYFWDEEPGFGEGTPIEITPGQEISVTGLGIPTEGLGAGHHLLFVRYRGDNGWSPTMSNEVNIMPENKVTSAEYFWNRDPGYGNGTSIAIDPAAELTLEALGIPTSDVHGDALFFIRYRGPYGWSPTLCYKILVDAEGNYTLNAQAETSIETRNYQSLADAFNDFNDRGVGNDITLTLPTSNTDYTLDATSDDVLAQVEAISASIERVSTLREGKTIGFKANANSGNTLSVTTTSEGLPSVINLFAHTWLENVTLTINGTTYDFTSFAANARYEEVCSEVATTPVSITAPTEGMTISFTAQPHQDIKLSGYEAGPVAALPAMTIVNSISKTDSIAYRVAMSDANGTELAAYTYYIYIRPRVSSQTFCGMKPATGSSLDPVATTLQWNAVPGAEGYRLTVTDTTGEEPVSVLDGFPVEKTSHTLSVESGHQYSWQVVAIGPCDELASPVMNFEGRLLPDLVVSTIALPEAAEAGNIISVTATIENQGEGATTEGTWTDRLYYVIDSEDFSQAVQVANQPHTGNLTVGASYDITFQLKVPQNDNGSLRVFVVADAASKVMETSDDNNRTLSGAATLKPFYMNTADLAALRKLYNDFGGTAWNGTAWNINSELITPDNWSGVSFDNNGCVTAINLQGRGLTGLLSVENTITLPELKSLNLSRNNLTGDPSLFITTDKQPALTTLNLSYNQIKTLSAALPAAITSVDLGCQDIDISITLTDLLNSINDLTSVLPSIATYQTASGTFNFNGYFQLANSNDNISQSWRMNVDNGSLVQVANPTVVYQEEKGHQVKMRAYNGNTWNDMRLTIDYIDGDANLDGLRNVADLQHTINYAVNDTHTRVFFNFKAADLQPDGWANVLDIVRLVNLLLADDSEFTLSRRRLKAHHSVNTETDARLVWEGQELVLITSRPVAAFDIILRTNGEAEIEWMPGNGDWLLSQNTTETSDHAIAYSLDGLTLPSGKTVLARISHGTASLGSAMLVDAEAREISVSVDGMPTGISETKADTGGQLNIYSADGIKHYTESHRKGVRIVNGKKKMVK